VIRVRRSFGRAYKKLTPQQQTTVDKAIAHLESSFGRPHLDAGIGLRPFGGYFEFRAGLGLRVLFVVQQSDPVLVVVGDHDAIRRFVKNTPI